MRTTVNIDEGLLAEAKVVAARSHRSLGTVIDDALRAMLSSRDQAAAQGRVALPTDGGSGLQPGVDLEDKDALALLLDDDAPCGAAG